MLYKGLQGGGKCSADDSGRKVWVDWMKAFGMLVIIWGHCFPTGLSPFIYSFSVPLFFVISGFLFKRQQSFSLFFRKNFHSIILPYLILCVIKDLSYWIKNIGDMEAFLLSPIAILSGFHTLFDAPGAKNLWFVYTLFILRLVVQLCGTGRHALLAVSLVSVAASVLYNVSGLDLRWAVTNSFLAMPYFVVGILCKNIINELAAKLMGVNRMVLFAVFCVLMLVVFVVSDFNGAAWMYQGGFGNNVVLFYLLGLWGTFAFFTLSVMLNDVHSKIISYISIGTIVILQFHRDVYHPIGKFIAELNPSVFDEAVYTLLASAVVLVVFVPIIMLLGRYAPVFIGGRKLG